MSAVARRAKAEAYSTDTEMAGYAALNRPTLALSKSTNGAIILAPSLMAAICRTSVGMDILWHIIYFAGTSKFLTLIGAFIISVLIAVFFPKIQARVAKYYSLIIILAFLNIFFGSGVAVRVVHAFGEKGTATITGSYGTSTQYNNHDVVGYHVLLKTANGTVVETSFRDDDFNIYPPKNGVIYPDVGDKFTVYYLRWFPNDFIIVDNDDSPWATALRCSALLDAVRSASAKANFSPGNKLYEGAYNDAIAKARGSGCDVSE